MRLLLNDRYVVLDGHRVCDLATGTEAPEVPEDDGAMTTDERLLPLLDMLDHGRDGEPRRFTLDLPRPHERRRLAICVGTLAQRHGYVPIAVRLYPQMASRLGDELRDRALVLVDVHDDGAAAERCLMAAAVTSRRPHVLVTMHGSSSGRAAAGCGGADRRAADRGAGGRSVAGRSTVGRSVGAASRVREARLAFGGSRPLAPPPEVQRILHRASQAAPFVRAGRHAAAERLLRESAGALERRRAHADAAAVTLELGTMLFERARLRDAGLAATDVVRLADQAGNVVIAAQARLLQAWIRIEQMAFADAEALSRAVLLCGGGEVATWAQVTLGKCLLGQGRLRELPDLEAGLEPLPRDATGHGARWLALATDVAVEGLIARRRLFDAGVLVDRIRQTWPDGADMLATTMVETARVRALGAAGQMRLADEALQRALDLARQARAPLRAWRAMAVRWSSVPSNAANPRARRDAKQLVARVQRLGLPLLVNELEQPQCPGRGVYHHDPASADANPAHLPDADANLAAELLRLSQQDDDAGAVQAVLAFVSKTLDAVRVDVVSADAGPPTIVASLGSGAATGIGGRVLESGIAIVSEGGRERGVPIRVGARHVAALVARWPAGRMIPPDHPAVLGCAAAVLAPRVDALRHAARDAACASTEIPELLGISAATAELRRHVLRAARAPFSVLVEGESGVGKELVARAIHQMSPRRDRRFCDVNCAALLDDLFESEVFGHAKGAFTGAVAERAGLFEEASGGTLFLDEVADLSPRAQAKLLRAVQQQEVRRVGESFARPVDVRLVAAANRRMTDEVAAGRFRADLLYRLDVIHIAIVPLRDRPEDIPAIAQHLWRHAAARVGTTAVLTPECIAALAHYAWPGNVRELQNVIAALAVAAPPRGRIRPSLLPPVISGSAAVSSARLPAARDQFERRFIELALARAGGNRTQAAQALGLSRQGLLKSMTRLGIRLPAPSSADE